MKKYVHTTLTIAISLVVTACGGEELGTCGLYEQPYTVLLSVGPNPALIGEEISVTSIVTDGNCNIIPAGTSVHFYVNGAGFEFPWNQKTEIDIPATDISATTVLVGNQVTWGVLHAVVKLDGIFINSDPIQIHVRTVKK